jgi:hypothetical protein
MGVNDVVRVDPKNTGGALEGENDIRGDAAGDGAGALRGADMGLAVEEEAKGIVGVEMLTGVVEGGTSEMTVGAKGIASYEPYRMESNVIAASTSSGPAERACEL